MRKTYQDGVKDGLHLAKNSFKRDIAQLYGMMCAVLIDEGNTEEDCLTLMAKIQERWISVADSEETVADYLERKLPFEIIQVIGE